MSATLSPPPPAAAAPRPFVPGTPVENPTLCATPSCTNLVSEYWEETGRLCGRCAIEDDLYDRETRRLRSFPYE